LREAFEVLGKATAAAQPGQSSFYHPSPRKKFETLHLIRSPDDLDHRLWRDRGDCLGKLWSLIAGVGKQLPQERVHPEQRREQQNTTVAILDVRWKHDHVQQQTYRVDQYVPLLAPDLLALDLLARIIAMRIDAEPPFSLLFTLWLSITPALGLASRSASSRHLT
jgi:hypothetical protein